MIHFESHILKQYKSIFYSKIYRPVLNVFGFSLGDFEGTTNYTYDAIGNLISDSGEKIEKIEWTLSGKVKRVVFADKPTLEFVYDPLGNRVAKIKKPSAVPTSWEYTYYSKDASGNTMAVYERKTTVANTATPYANDNNTDILRPTEYPLYGSSRLGNYMPQFANQTSAVYTLQADNVRNYNAPYYTYNTKNTHLNERNYELSDHLGNVSATLSDYKTNNKAQILSAHVYYPYGMEMGIKTRSLGKYRYGFNGKEKDNEGLGGGGSTYDYGFRIYNPNLARFLSVDPLTKGYPMLTPYQFASNQPIWAIDLDGLERRVIIYKLSDMSQTYFVVSTDKNVEQSLVTHSILGLFNWDNSQYQQIIKRKYGENNIHLFESTLTIYIDDNSNYVSSKVTYDKNIGQRTAEKIVKNIDDSKGDPMSDGFSNAPFKSAGIMIEAETTPGVEGLKVKTSLSLGGNNSDNVYSNSSVTTETDINTKNYNKLGAKSESSDLNIYLFFSSKKMKREGFDFMQSESSLGTSLKFSHFRFSYTTTGKDYNLKIGLGLNASAFEFKINEKFSTKALEYNTGEL